MLNWIVPTVSSFVKLPLETHDQEVTVKAVICSFDRNLWL